MEQPKPRGLSRYKTDYNLRDIYREYCANTIPSIRLTYAKYVEVISMYNKELMDTVLIESKAVKLPGVLGDLSVMKMKMVYIPSKLKIDRMRSKDAKNIVYHLNEHRNGYAYKFFWRKNKSRVALRSLYSLVICRTAKRKLAYILKNNFDIDYYA
jgi:hypothetical protein